MFRVRTVAALAVALSVPGLLAAQPAIPPQAAEHRPTILTPQHHDVTPALRDMRLIAPERENQETPHPPFPVHGGPRFLSERRDGALQTAPASLSAITPKVSFEGIGNTAGVLPPDTNGDVGPNHYIQWVNLSFAIFRKTDGAVLYGPADGKTLWQGFSGPCSTSNDGDPIVLYDEIAGRWLMSQFALPNYPRGPYYQCIAVSTTDNPLGSWNRYSYSFSKMNDYPKFGVWPDGYYMTMNQFSNCNIFGCSWGGQGVVAFERSQMLSGGPARAVYFDMAAETSLGGMLPADLDGPTLPPAGAPAYFMQIDDQPDQLQLWQFRADWNNIQNSAFTRKALLPTSAFDSNMCGGSRNCIPQPAGAPKLDALADRLMYRLQYRNFGTHETLVTNHTVDVGSDRGAVRWYEVRNPGAAPVIYQQGTFGPADTLNRWLGSAAMDASGNLAIGYSVSNTTTFPSIRFSGRLAGDPLGTLTVAESDIQTGSGAQGHSSGRWGDYSMLAVDPTDGCTFWFTSEYYLGSSSAGWRTGIGSFRLNGCGGTPPPPTAPAAPSALSASAPTASTVNLAWTDNSSDETGFAIERCVGAGCLNFAPLTTTAAGATTYTDSGLAASTTYTYRVQAVNAALNLSSGYSNSAAATTPTDQQPPATDPTMHVGALAAASAANGKMGWKASVTITVANNDGPVANATVNVSWSNGYSGTDTCLTNASGACTVTTGRIANTVSSVRLNVTSLSHATLTYQPAANAASAITVNKP
jgi:Fibronectin type III domain